MTEAASAFQPIVELRGAAGICATFADDMSMCETSLAQAGSVIPVSAKVTTSTELADGSVVLFVSGELAGESDGMYSGFVQFVRVGGTVVAVDPVYWLTRNLGEELIAVPSP